MEETENGNSLQFEVFQKNKRKKRTAIFFRIIHKHIEQLAIANKS